MSYSDMLKPRKEVLSEDGIEGIIDLQNINDSKGKKLEANPKRFFSLTYPTADIKRVVQKLADRFTGTKDAPGLFLFEAEKGSGKSHILLLVYHLFKNYSAAKEWLDANSLYCELPEDTVVVLNKFTDRPLYSIWDFVFKKLTGKSPKKTVVQPGLAEVEKALGDRRLILILDELEKGISIISDPAIRQQNIAFLQMLSEWANRSDKVTVFASIYKDSEEPGSTLKRVPNTSVRFSHYGDRANVILHRLFSNYLDFNHEDCIPVIDSYFNAWKKQEMRLTDEYKTKMLQSYPFIPEMMELILEKVPARGGFQSVRGALGFLGNMVRFTHEKTDLITAGHADLLDREVSSRLQELDASGDLIPRAKSNLHDLKDQPLASEITATTMLYTLTSSGRDRGVSREELLKHVLSPSVDINNFEKTLLAFQKYASHFWLVEGRYFFDLEENPDAKVEYRSLTIDPDGSKSINFLHNLWKNEIFGEPNSVIFQCVEETKSRLEELDKNRLRFVLAPRRLKQKDRHDLFHGVQMRNQVILLEPKDTKFVLERHDDLIKWAKRHLAAQELAMTARDNARRAEYEKIMREDKGHCIDTIKRAGLIYILWNEYGADEKEDSIEEEQMPGAKKDDVLKELSQRLYPVKLFEEHISSRIPDIVNQVVSSIDREYRSTLGFPVPTGYSTVGKALRELCRDGLLGIKHRSGNFCKENPGLNDTELSESIISESFEAGVTPPIFRPVPPTPEGGTHTPSPVIEALEVEGERLDIRILPQGSLGSLRQQAALKLQEYPDAKILKLQARIFASITSGDLSVLPSSLRGSLSGSGAVTAEITITKEGQFDKAEIETILESLPTLPDAEYDTSLDIVIEKSHVEGRAG